MMFNLVIVVATAFKLDYFFSFSLILRDRLYHYISHRRKISDIIEYITHQDQIGNSALVLKKSCAGKCVCKKGRDKMIGQVGYRGCGGGR